MSPNTKEKILCFQDAIESYNKDDEEDDVANVFFELANAPLVSYRLSKRKEIVVKQDIGACGQHTGGIVWETAYLLLNYLRSQQISCRTLLEVGAGCGLVGLGVHMAEDISIAETVIMTETQPVMNNLTANFERNYPKTSLQNDGSLRVCKLDWNSFQEDCEVAQIKPHSIDTIVGTDVVFSTKLVEPLLKTLRFLAHDQTMIYLCLQERCKDSHQLLLDKAKDHELEVHDISEEVTSVSTCEWGKELECCLLKLTVTPTKEKKRKRK